MWIQRVALGFLNSYGNGNKKMYSKNAHVGKTSKVQKCCANASPKTQVQSTMTCKCNSVLILMWVHATHPQCGPGVFFTTIKMHATLQMGGWEIKRSQPFPLPVSPESTLFSLVMSIRMINIHLTKNNFGLTSKISLSVNKVEEPCLGLSPPLGAITRKANLELNLSIQLVCSQKWNNKKKQQAKTSYKNIWKPNQATNNNLGGTTTSLTEQEISERPIFYFSANLVKKSCLGMFYSSNSTREGKQKQEITQAMKSYTAKKMLSMYEPMSM